MRRLLITATDALTAMAAESAEAARPNAIIGIGAVLILTGSLVRLPRRR